MILCRVKDVISSVTLTFIWTAIINSVVASSGRQFTPDELKTGESTSLPPYVYRDITKIYPNQIHCAIKCAEIGCFAFRFNTETHVCGIYQSSPPPATQGISLTTVNGHGLYTSYGGWDLKV